MWNERCCIQCIHKRILFFQDYNGCKINKMCVHSISPWLYSFCSQYTSDWKEKSNSLASGPPMVFHLCPILHCVHLFCTFFTEVTPCSNTMKSTSYEMCTELCWKWLLHYRFVIYCGQQFECELEPGYSAREWQECGPGWGFSAPCSR